MWHCDTDWTCLLGYGYRCFVYDFVFSWEWLAGVFLCSAVFVKTHSLSWWIVCFPPKSILLKTKTPMWLCLERRLYTGHWSSVRLWGSPDLVRLFVWEEAISETSLALPWSCTSNLQGCERVIWSSGLCYGSASQLTLCYTHAPSLMRAWLSTYFLLLLLLSLFIWRVTHAHTEKSSIFWFTFLVVDIARVRSGLRQVPGASLGSLMWAAGAQTLGSSFPALPGVLVRS